MPYATLQYSHAATVALVKAVNQALLSQRSLSRGLVIVWSKVLPSSAASSVGIARWACVAIKDRTWSQTGLKVADKQSEVHIVHFSAKR